MPTKIEWATESWNIVSGCSKISTGCAHCYAERRAKMLKAKYGYPSDDPFRVTFHRDKLDKPLHWKKPRKVFVCSMSDIGHEDILFSWFQEIMFTIRKCPQHTFMMLTKRPINLLKRFNDFYDIGEVWPNIWIGTTVENSDYLWRIEKLLEIPAALHFVSIEPMLSGMDISEYLKCQSCLDSTVCWCKDSRIKLVICGCESGPKRRECKIKWVRDLKNQCVDAGVPFFLKQLAGQECKTGTGDRYLTDRVFSMPELDGKVWDQWPDLSG
jgi:protein gp37